MMTQSHTARFGLGQIVRHRDNSFRGVIVDADAAYAGPESGPRPEHPDQPFYQVFAPADGGGVLVYAAEEVLEADAGQTRLDDETAAVWFNTDANGRHAPKSQPIH